MKSRRVLAACCLATFLVGGAAFGAEYRIDKRFDLPSGGSFSLVSEAGGVELRGGDGAQAVIVITSRQSDFEELYEVRFEQSRPDRLEVRIERRGRGLFRWSLGSSQGAQVTVELPRGVAAEVESSGGGIEINDVDAKVSAESSGGGVGLSNVTGDVVVSSSGGGIEVSRIGGSARLESSGGGVKARDIGGDVDASSSGGGVRIEEAHGAVVAESSGGPVRVGFGAGNAKGGDLSSSGGGVEVRVDPAVGLEVDASTSGGRVHCDLPVTVRGKLSKDKLRGPLNGGGALLKLRSSGGGITIDAR